MHDGDNGYGCVTCALACVGAQVVVGESKLHLVATLHGGVGGNLGELHLGSGGAASTSSATELIGLAYLFSFLVKERQRIGLAVTVAIGVKPQRCSKVAAYLLDGCGNGFVLRWVGAVLVDGLISHHFGYLEIHLPVCVGSEHRCNGALCDVDFLHYVLGSVLYP